MIITGAIRSERRQGEENMLNCLIIGVVHPLIAEELGKVMNVTGHQFPTQEELKEMIVDQDVLIMRVDPKIDQGVLDAAKKLKMIGVCAVGLNHIDMEYAKAKGVQVFNAPGMNGNAVAELTISKMLDISRGTMQANYDVKMHKQWDKNKFVGRELRGRTLGILGFGRIGQRVGELARAFGMTVVAYDPYLPAEVFEQQHAKSVSVEELCAVSDYITIHLPLTEETRNMFNADSFARMKPDAVLLNMSRGNIVNEQDAYEALVSGRLGGYATDVMSEELVGSGIIEGIDFDSPLFGCENFIVSPHIGAQTTDASRAIGQYIVDKVKSVFQLN